MKASTSILLGLIVVLVILIIYAVARDPVWSRRSFWSLRASRPGGGGPVPVLTVGGHFAAARGIARDLAERITGGRAQTRAVRELYEQAEAHYTEALRGLRETRLPAHVRPRARGGARAGGPHAVQIIDAALGFAFADFMGGDFPQGAEVFFDVANEGLLRPGDIFFNLNGQIPLPGPGLVREAVARRDEVIHDRARAAHSIAAEEGGALGAATDTYIDLATQQTSDPQNVHDPGVLACFKAILTRLREDQGPLDALPGLDAIAEGITQQGPRLSKNRPEVVKRALDVVQRTRDGERVAGFDATDAECLRRVWARADDPRNAGSRDLLRQALFDVLTDECWEPALGGGMKIVCVTGRSTQILSSLVLKDWDERNWEVKRLEQFKNEIFEETKRVINAVALRAATSADPEKRQAGRAYLATTAAEMREIGEVREEAAKQLADEMRTEIDAAVDAYVDRKDRDYDIKGAIPSYLIASVKEEAKAAVVV